MRYRLLLLGLALILTLAACGGDDSAPDDAPPDDTGAESDDTAPAASGDSGVVPEDACALVSTATVDSIAEGTTAEPTEGTFGSDFGAAAGCRWDDGDFIYPLELSVTGSADAYGYSRELVTELGGIETPDVTGVGDEAFTFDEGSGVLEVVTRQGDVVVSVRARTTNGALPIAIANEVLGNL